MAVTSFVVGSSAETVSSMDIAKSGHKAIICPTPGQYEQIYLADRLANLGQCVYGRQENLNLSQALQEVNLILPIGQRSDSLQEDLFERLAHLSSHNLKNQSSVIATT